MEDVNKIWVQRESKTCLQLFFVYHDGILNRDLVVSMNVRVLSVNPEKLSRDVVIVVQSVYIPWYFQYLLHYL